MSYITSTDDDDHDAFTFRHVYKSYNTSEMKWYTILEDFYTNKIALLANTN